MEKLNRVKKSRGFSDILPPYTLVTWNVLHIEVTQSIATLDSEEKIITKLKNEYYWFLCKRVFVISKAQQFFYQTLNCFVLEITQTFFWHAIGKFSSNSVLSISKCIQLSYWYCNYNVRDWEKN